MLSERTHLRLPSKPHWIEATVEWLRQKAVLAGACQETRAHQLLVALHEAISNAIVHGNLELSSALKEQGDDAFARALAECATDERLSCRVVDVHIEFDVGHCRWIVTDEGNGFDVDAVLQRHQSDDPEVLLSSGRGILIMKSFLDEVRWELGGRRLILGLARTSGEEKRQELRVPRHQPLRVAPILPDGTVDWPAAYEAVSRNYSENGIGLLQQGLAETDRILIGMSVQGQMMYVPAEVRHCRSGAGDLVELGCRFQTQPAPGPGLIEAASAVAAEPRQPLQQAITDLMENFKAPTVPADERRRDTRIMYTERIDIQTAPGAALLAGFARDLSKSGIAFVVHAELPQQITLLLRPRDGGPSLKVRSRVVRCNKIIEGFYDIGAEFMHLENS
jgi:anti-sigma regulatory factor (Ser/Thr protein kinase)